MTNSLHSCLAAAICHRIYEFMYLILNLDLVQDQALVQDCPDPGAIHLNAQVCHNGK